MKKTAKNVARDVKPKICLWQTDFKRGLSQIIPWHTDKLIELRSVSKIVCQQLDKEGDDIGRH